MKRLIILLCVVGFIVALPLSHVGAAGKAPEKVAICHIVPANDVIPFVVTWGPTPIPGTLYFGREIEVAAAAVDVHIENGDFLKPYVGPADSAGPIQAFRDTGAKLPAADCFKFVAD